MNRVCHVTSVHPRYDVRIFLKECVSLAKAGYEVTLLCADNLPAEIRDGVTIKSVDYFPSGRIKRILGAKKAILKGALEIDADIYHLHDPELLPVARSLKKRGKIVIFDSHEDVPRQILNKQWIPRPLRKIISYIFEMYEKRSAQKIDHIITATPYIETIFRESTDQVTTICNFPKISEFDDLPEVKNESGTICYIGGITQNRGIFQLIKAIETAQIELHLCGDFESEKLKQEITSLAGFKYAKYHGYLNRTDIIKILSESSIGIVTLLPTRNHLNSYPIKMFEYMAAGIPVIASDFPLWREVIEGNHCGVCVDPLNAGKIAEAITFLTENPRLSSSMGSNGRKAILEKYNWENEEKKLLHLYAQLLNPVSMLKSKIDSVVA